MRTPTWMALVLLLAAPLLAAPARIARPGAELRADVGFGGAVLARPSQGSAV
jgi:hypothetical protein